jgi:mannose/fructose-specific phosphotransferase system component IIA
MKKHDQFAIKLLSAIHDVLSNEENANHIPMTELEDDKNATDFFHALTNIVPCHVYN